MEYCSNASYSSLAFIECGSITNVREGTVNNKSVILVDIKVQQYGMSEIYITGMHPDITEITDVTDDVIE